MDYNELMRMLNGYFNWNKARMSCFVGMLVALLKVRTVNLTELACGFSSKATIDSRYKRIKRFFKEFTIHYPSVAFWVVEFFGFREGQLHLSMDRTNWQWGKKDINILMLSIIYKGIAIPLFWSLLNKQGNSNTEERIEIMERFIAQFGENKIAGLLADREFVGNAWFDWLLKKQIPFCIRIKSNTITTNARGLEVNVSTLFSDLKPGEQRILEWKGKLWEQRLYLSALRLDDGELLTRIFHSFFKESVATLLFIRDFRQFLFIYISETKI